ncbi:MAG TPA: type I secretion system permease/ATPase [Stellaceae bacterium]|nr:type I secretion system permease/ATPase [Stellaceae bacterium]
MNPQIKVVRPQDPASGGAKGGNADARPTGASPTDAPPTDAPPTDDRLAAAIGAIDDPLLISLSVLSGLLERPTSPQALRAGLPLVDDKLTPETFVRAAARIGISARLVKRSLDKISALNVPCVLLLKEGGACVLTGFPDRDSALIIVPETGIGAARLPRVTLAEQYLGYVLVAKPEFRFDERTEAMRREGPDRNWFWGTLRRFWRVYAHAAIATLMINLFALAAPLFTMNVYDRVIPNNATDTLLVLASGVIILYGFDFILRMARSHFIDDAGKRADVLFASQIFSQVMGMRYEVRPPSTGAFAATLRDYESLRDFFTSATLTTLVDLPFAALFLAVIWFIAGPVAIIPTIAVPIAILIGAVVQAPMHNVVRKTSRESFQKHAILLESLEGLDMLKISGAEGRAQRRWERLIGVTAETSVRARFYSTLAIGLTGLLQNMVTVLIVIYGAYLIGQGALTTGALVACTILGGRALAPLSQLAAITMRFNQSLASLRALDKVMAMPQERPADKVFLHRPRLKGRIEFQNVSFQYPTQKSPSLNGVSFTIDAGQKVGIIGRIGSGKSTITRLITGLYQPTGGAILLDGTDIRQIDPADLRGNIGYAAQDAFLFFGSVKDNICLAAPHADHAAILRAATTAGVDDFVRGHADGYDMSVGEHGRYLSGGQRESIGIARALLLDPPMLILDEPTGALDNGGEGRFRARMNDAARGKTLLLVTHRHTMLSLVDFLIVLDGGKVVASGPKDKVLKAMMEGQIRVAAMA